MHRNFFQEQKQEKVNIIPAYICKTYSLTSAQGIIKKRNVGTIEAILSAIRVRIDKIETCKNGCRALIEIMSSNSTSHYYTVLVKTRNNKDTYRFCSGQRNGKGNIWCYCEYDKTP